MAAYPSFYWQADGSDVGRNGGFEADRATNGVLKVRALYPADKRDFQLTHWLSDADKATLDTFYATNKLLDVSLTAADDGVTYTVRFVAAPAPKRRDSFWVVRVHLLEV